MARKNLYRRILDAYENGKGLSLSPLDVAILGVDSAIEQRMFAVEEKPEYWDEQVRLAKIILAQQQ